MKLALAVALIVLATGCDPAPSNVREWAPSDHDQSAPNNAAGQVSARADPGGEGLIELAWNKDCAACHGTRGRGDGPQGPMVRAPDLTRAEWQDKATDEDMKATMRKGRNKMPAFPDLPPAVLDGLVKRIRASRAR